jgi:hypothetical protein
LFVTVLISSFEGSFGLRYLSLIGNFLSLILIGVLIVVIFHPVSTFFQEIPLVLFSSKDFYNSDLLIISFTIFYSQPFLHRIFSSTSHITIQNTNRNLFLSLSIGLILDIFTGVSGFFTLPVMETRTNLFYILDSKTSIGLIG